MCRNIKPLFNFDPPATDEEIHAAAVQFARKLSGFGKPSDVNIATIEIAAQEFALIARRLLDSLVTSAKPKNREAEAAKVTLSSERRFGGIAKTS